MEKDLVFEKNFEADILYIGTALVDSIVKEWDPVPISRSGYRAKAGTLHAGGEAVNGAVASSKLGLSSAIFCSLGDDDAGKIVLSCLERYGVDIRSVIIDRNRQTPVTTMLVEKDGSRKSITNLSHAINFHPERYLDRLSGYKVIALTSLFRTPFDEPEIIKQIVLKAKENGSIVFADTKIPNFKEIALEDVKESLPYVDYIFPNEDEARYFTGKETAEDMADVFLDYGVGNVIIKLGEKGCYFKNRNFHYNMDGFPVEAVDATGAGDNFGAAFASALLSGKKIKEALLFANACGAISTMEYGAHSALKSKEQVERLIKAGSEK